MTLVSAMSLGADRLRRAALRTHGGRSSLQRAWKTGGGPGAERLVVDVDSFVGEVHGRKKQGAAFGCTKSAVTTRSSRRADTAEVLHIRLRKGLSEHVARDAALHRCLKPAALPTHRWIEV